uniref:Capsid protein n=1 Tax=Fox astrovirus TaxID=1328104 RepID=N0A3J7_9VIRU|nr:capsid protein [Fox astrovirus]
MASNAQAAKTKATIKEVAKEVAKEAIKETKNGQGPRKWHRPGPKKNNQNKGQMNQKPKTQQTVQKAVNKKLKKEGLEGPRSRFSVRVSATIGKIGPNTSQGPELQVSTFLHPSLMKEPNDGTNFGPLQAASAQWGLWRLTDLKVVFTPLVGSSAVTGSVYRTSLNLTQSPGSTSWGGLGARKHLDIPVGRQMVWTLHRGDLAGPRQTWWLTDTNEEGGQSCGPMVEIHGLGKTTSTYKDEAWNGDLFIVEINGRWEFTNYNAKPALGTLDRVTEDTNASIEVNSEGMVMSIPKGTQLALHMGERYERIGTNASSVGETIWQVVDEGAGLVANVAPPPFTWLIKGGWWFVKKLLGRANASEEQYLVYASLADAQNNKPVEAPTFQKQTHATTLTVTQINAPNTGPSGGVSEVHAGPIYPIAPIPSIPTQPFRVMGQAVRLLTLGDNSSKGGAGGCVIARFSSGQSGYRFPFTFLKGSEICGQAFNGLVFTKPPIIITESLSKITGVYDPGSIPSIGWTVKLNIPTVVDDYAEVLGVYHEQWVSGSTRLTLSLYFVRFLKSVDASANTYDIHVPSCVLGASAELAPTTFNIGKIAFPRINNDGTKVWLTGTTIGQYGVLYTVGNQVPSPTTMKATIPTLAGNVNDYNLPQQTILTSGMTATATTSVAEASAYITSLFTRPTVHDDVEDIMEKIRLRFGLTPRVDSSSEDSDSDCGEEPPSYDDPMLRLAKPRVYDALRDADWDQVDATQLAEAIRASRSPNRRGPAE